MFPPLYDDYFRASPDVLEPLLALMRGGAPMCAGPGQPPEPPQRDWRSPDEKLRSLLDATTDPTMRQLIDIVLELALDMPEDTIDDLQSLRTDVSALTDRLDNAEDRIDNLELED